MNSSGVLFCKMVFDEYLIVLCLGSLNHYYFGVKKQLLKYTAIKTLFLMNKKGIGCN
jgi:hypothetical protein